MNDHCHEWHQKLYFETWLNKKGFYSKVEPKIEYNVNRIAEGWTGWNQQK